MEWLWWKDPKRRVYSNSINIRSNHRLVRELLQEHRHRLDRDQLELVVVELDVQGPLDNQDDLLVEHIVNYKHFLVQRHWQRKLKKIQEFNEKKMF